MALESETFGLSLDLWYTLVLCFASCTLKTLIGENNEERNFNNGVRSEAW